MNSFIKNNSLLIQFSTPCDLDWRIIGSSSWDCYQQSILDTITSATVENVANLVGSSGSFPGGLAYVGGVLLPDGRVFCVPYNATRARVYGGGESFNINVLLSAYLNKF